MLKQNAQLFGERYTLVRLVDQGGEYELWEARDTFGGPILIKAWPFGGNKPADEERALWNAELRHLFRLASLPEGDEHLVVLRDAGMDWTHRCFAMAMLTPGLSLLDSVLSERTRYEWLRDLTNQAVRAELWRGIRRLALGLIQLHQQQMFHRAVSARCVLVDPERGPSTLRLGGFEWTVRLGDTLRAGTLSAPQPAETYSFESDWFLLGSLIARLIAATGPDWDHERVITTIGQRQHLAGDERDLLEALLADDPTARLSQGQEIVRRIDQIITVLDETRKLSPEDYLALIVLLGPQRPLTLAVMEIDETISALEIERQRKFIEDDLLQPRIVRRDGTGRETFTLVGNRLRYLLTEHARNEGAAGGSWDLAYCGAPTELRNSTGDDDQLELRRVPIRVFTLRAIAADENVVRRTAIAWKSYLPRRVSRGAEQDKLQRIHDFFRVTNQVELLMRDAEIFAYTIIESRFSDGAEEVLLREILRTRGIPEFAKLIEGLPEFLKREEENRDGDLVYLGDEEALDLAREVPRTEFWTVTDANPDNGVVTLRRPKRVEQPSPPPRGFLRAFGLFGQMSLIKRRKRAIDRLGSHAYLLRALESPSFTFLDTGATLPRPIDPLKIDGAKSAAMQSIWRTRPIFALQGPPGTGKTTLVANLLAQVFEDDPVAQVLVTAQAHAAVDVLRDKVRVEFAEMPNPPLAVRLQRTKGDLRPDPDYVDQVARRMLSQAISDLGMADKRTPLQSRWLESAQEVVRALVRGDTKGHAKDFCELVKRAAGITYCTTTAGNLASLADSTQTFDWSIVEEAGKAHGFDLALPLQTGHRWLLIGDQKQLEPYRYENFRDALLHLDVTLDAIQKLPKRAGGQVDIDLVLRWNKYDTAERESRRDLWLHWLLFFETVHATCSRVKLGSEEGESSGPGGPVLAEMLSRQHRMHPTIADLVSTAYYRKGIESETYGDDHKPLPRVTHHFSQPSGLLGRAILWLDIPWVGSNERDDNRPSDSEGRYTSDAEVEAVARLLSALKTESADPLALAILSPYRRQVQRLNERLSLPDWAKPNGVGSRREANRPAATVDSFQGNQAEVVIVSLVRNNSKSPGNGLGFLRESRRMNVLFSRAERLLVLVGSWDFFQYQLANVPPDDTQPLGHWRLAMDYLETCLKSGSAIRIAANSIKEEL
ncbi:MAG: AAA domain-containing protein [Acidobacteria bacterium]|nr:AAA domain-containing protein [Acidobacteriota bacterium]